jgi:CBS-domain-containing membrane protein
MIQTATQQPPQPTPDQVTVADVMRPPLTTADTNDHTAAAAYLMKHATTTTLMVLDTQTRGILTEADIAHAVADGKDLNPGQDSPLASARLDPLTDRHLAILAGAFRKLDAAAVLTARLLPAPRHCWISSSLIRLWLL